MRNPVIVTAALLATLAVAGIALRAQQDKASRPSPPAKAECKIDGKTVTVDYSSPRAKGRKIFGSLVPYGQVWRAGANEATTLVTSGDINIRGKTVPAGEYTIFAIPAQDKLTPATPQKPVKWAPPSPAPRHTH